MYIATIDGGTTNTRTLIWENDKLIGEAGVNVGVRNTAIDGNNDKLIAAVHDTLAESVKKAQIREDEISLILAAGMLTSNVGIVEIPHISAPVTLENLAQSMVSINIPKISSIPIWFIPGIKNISDQNICEKNITSMDIMRGEEAEAAGLIDLFSAKGNLVLILPGSHNKYIALNNRNTLWEILGCMTTLTGELLNSLTFDTILADSTGREFASEFDEEAFLRGVTYRKDSGFGHAAFMARILNLFNNYTFNQVQNYLLGILLEDDLQALKKNPLFTALLDDPTFIITGKTIMQQAYRCLLKKEGWDNVIVSGDKNHALSGVGVISLAKKRGLIV